MRLVFQNEPAAGRGQAIRASPPRARAPIITLPASLCKPASLLRPERDVILRPLSHVRDLLDDVVEVVGPCDEVNVARANNLLVAIRA